MSMENNQSSLFDNFRKYCLNKYNILTTSFAVIFSINDIKNLVYNFAEFIFPIACSIPVLIILLFFNLYFSRKIKKDSKINAGPESNLGNGVTNEEAQKKEKPKIFNLGRVFKILIALMLGLGIFASIMVVYIYKNHQQYPIYYLVAQKNLTEEQARKESGKIHSVLHENSLSYKVRIIKQPGSKTMNQIIIGEFLIKEKAIERERKLEKVLPENDLYVSKPNYNINLFKKLYYIRNTFFNN
jgi:hypothetical protein